MHAGARRDGRLDARGVDVEGALVRLHRHRRGPALADGQPGGDVGVAGHDDFVARPDVHGAQRQMQGIQAVGHAHAVGGAAVGGVVGLEGIDLGAEDEPAGADHAGNGFVQFRLQFEVGVRSGTDQAKAISSRGTESISSSSS